MCSVPFEVCVVLFVEGTRVTPGKLELAQEFAKTKGLAVPRHVLIPRPKARLA